VNSIASDNQSMRVRTSLVSWEKCAFTMCVHIYISVFVVGFGRWRGTFWLLNESLTFMGPAAQQATAIY